MRPKRFDPKKDYPIASKRADLVKTSSGIDLQDITPENVASGKIVAHEIRIRPETLELQARIAEAHGRSQMAANFRRAAELVHLPDEEILRIYNALRPCRSTKKELLAIAQKLEETHLCPINADFVREATESYGKRNLLRKK